jgi:hypothetical protein
MRGYAIYRAAGRMKEGPKFLGQAKPGQVWRKGDARIRYKSWSNDGTKSTN